MTVLTFNGREVLVDPAIFDLPEEQLQAKLSEYATLAAKHPIWKGGVLPISQDPSGRFYFDSSAGLLGIAKSGVTAPRDAVTGDLDPKSDAAIERMPDLATLASPTLRFSRTRPVPPSTPKLRETGNTQMKEAEAGAPAGADLARRGRDNIAAAGRSDLLMGRTIENSLERAQNVGRKKEFDQVSREHVDSILRDKSKRDTFLPEQAPLLNAFAIGSKGRNTAGKVDDHVTGSLKGLYSTAGTTLGGVAGAVVGAAAGEPFIGAAIGGGGAYKIGDDVLALTSVGAKRVMNALAERELKGLDETVRSASPLFREGYRDFVEMPQKSAFHDALVRAAIVTALRGRKRGQTSPERHEVADFEESAQLARDEPAAAQEARAIAAERLRRSMRRYE
jgi:hypothetical protein